MNINTIHNRIISWNAARYPQVFNKELQYNLAFGPDGEVQEYFDAANAVDRLDALGDIYFVAVGGMWKAGLTNQSILKAIQAELGTGTPVATFEECEAEFDRDPVTGFAKLIVRVMFEANGMGLDGVKFLLAVNAICDSNDTKPAVKTDPSVKANIDKGATYVPPTEALQAILAEVKHV